MQRGELQRPYKHLKDEEHKGKGNCSLIMDGLKFWYLHSSKLVLFDCSIEDVQILPFLERDRSGYLYQSPVQTKSRYLLVKELCLQPS